MTAAVALREAREAGLTLAVSPTGSIACRGPSAVAERFKPRLIENRVAVLALLAAEAAPQPSATVSADTSASVDALIADMAAENERRRDWHKQPLSDWRAGYIKFRSALTGETTIIRFHNRGRA
jgi:hypothetical protein